MIILCEALRVNATRQCYSQIISRADHTCRAKLSQAADEVTLTKSGKKS